MMLYKNYILSYSLFSLSLKDDQLKKGKNFPRKLRLAKNLMVDMPIICNRMTKKKKTNLRLTHKISKRNFTKHMGCNNDQITTLNIFLLS